MCAPSPTGRGVSELAFSFGRIAAEYDDVRPEYAPEALDRAEDALGLCRESRVVDLAAGSGKLTRALADRFDGVVAVEPSNEMRAVLTARSDGIEVLAGTAERIPLPDGSADAVFTAEAFHWFASDESVAEIVRVLRPRGALVILWNIGMEDDDMGEEAEAVIKAAIERGGVPGIGRVLSGEWRRPVEAAAFEPLREAEVERDLVNTRDEWIANMLSVSSIAHQPDEERAAFAERMRELIPADREVRRRVRNVAHWTRCV